MLIDISDGIEWQAATLPPTEAALSDELCAIHGLTRRATSRLRVVQANYPDQLSWQ